MKSNEPKAETYLVYRVIATTLTGDPFRSCRGEHHDLSQASAQLKKWKANGDSGYIKTERRENGYLSQCLDG